MPPSLPYNGKETLERVAKGDEIAFRQLFDHYKAAIYSAALRITRSEAAAEELLQDVFMIIWLRREKIPAIDDFPSYLFIVARNEAYRALKKAAKERRQLRDNEIPDDIYDIDTEATLSVKDYQNYIRKIVDQLPPQQKRAYLLIKEQGLSREDAAVTMQISPQTVKTHLAQALKTIRIYISARFETNL